MDFLKSAVNTFSGATNQGNPNPTQSQGGYQVQNTSSSGAQQGSADGDDNGFRLPGHILEIIDKYVDTYEPGIAKGIADELMAFEAATIGALEQHIKEAFIGVFKGDYSSFQSNNSIQQFRAIREQPQSQQTNYGPNMPQHNYPSTSIVTSRGQGGDLPEYGQRGLPFAGGAAAAAAGASGVAVLTQQLANVNMQGDAKPEPQHQKNIFDQALGKVKDFAKDTVDDVQDGIEGEVKKMANEIQDVADHIEEKVAELGPDLKAKIADLIQKIHIGLADLMTKAALSCIKAFLGSVIKLKEIEEQAVEGVKDLAQMFLHQDGDPNQPGQQDIHPAAGLLSTKLSSGLTVIRGNSRHHFRDYLAKIEEEFFNDMPNGIKDILAKIFGGNPFDATQNVQQQKETLGDKLNIFEEIGDKIKAIVERIQNALRDRVLEIVGGGHRRLEDKAWGNVQDSVVGKVQQYVPNVQVHLQDDPPQGGVGAVSTQPAN